MIKSILQLEHDGPLRKIERIKAPLLAWYDVNKRALPWRESTSPYAVWVSEIMLQQTRVEAVLGYYIRFLDACPNIESLALLPEDRLLKLWEGLGYYNRARNLQKAARLVLERHNGELPADYGLLRELPGIGDYTAGAVASIAFGLRVPAVDGNVCRVFARLLASRADLSGAEVKKAMQEIALGLVSSEARPGDWNQSLMELGATICLPNGVPLCGECPVCGLCESKRLGLELEIPVKVAKKARRVEERTICFLRSDTGLLLFQRPNSGLLRSLYEPLNLASHLSERELREHLARMGLPVRSIRELPEAKHIFTHVEWRMRAWEIETDALPASGGVWAADVRDYAVASAFRHWEL